MPPLAPVLRAAAIQRGVLDASTSLNVAEAVRIASLHPAAQLGEELGWAIEVRPVKFFVEPGA